MSKLDGLIRLFDTISWVPTIRGCLSLDIIDNPETLWGDVDKYVVKFRRINNGHSEHHILATSLHTVNDSKHGPEIYRTFRFFFQGAVNDGKINADFIRANHLNDLNDDNSLIDQVFSDGILLGKLFIVKEDTSSFSDCEKKILTGIRQLSKDCKDTPDDACMELDSFDDFNSKRNAMQAQWEDIAQNIDKLSTVKESLVGFDAALTRDGILFLRICHSTIDHSTSDNDSGSQWMPMLGTYRMAMNYIKYLFHTNYHHNKDNDVYLPLYNIKPFRAAETIDLTAFFKHHVDAFCTPVASVRRNQFKEYSVEVNGVLLYAKAFVSVCKHNELVTRPVAERTEEFLLIQEQEVSLTTNRHRTLVVSLLDRRYSLFAFTGVLVLTAAVVQILSFFVTIPKIELQYTPDKLQLITDTPLFLLFVKYIGSFVIVVYSAFLLPQIKVRRRQFHPKKTRQKLWMQDSNLKKGRISCAYKMYIVLSEIGLIIGQYRIQFIAAGLYFIMACFFAVVLFCRIGF